MAKEVYKGSSNRLLEIEKRDRERRAEAQAERLRQEHEREEREKAGIPNFFGSSYPRAVPPSPSPSPAPDILDAQNNFTPDAQLSDILDAQNAIILGVQVGAESDAQNIVTLGVQDDINLDTQSGSSIDVQSNNLLDAQRPILDAQSESPPLSLDASLPKKSITRTPKRAEGKWAKYEETRERSGARGRVNIRPLNAILLKVKHYLVEHDIEMQDWFENASIEYMKVLDAQKQSDLGSRASTDDDRLMMKFNTNLTIINLYSQITDGNKWTLKDDQAAAGLNDRDYRVIELAMIRTRIRALRRSIVIKWFKYFRDEIDLAFDEYAKTDSQMLDMQLMRNRELLDLARKGIEVDA